MPSKTATFVPEFAVEDLPLSRTATLVFSFPVKDLPWAEHSDGDGDDDGIIVLSHPTAEDGCNPFNKLRRIVYITQKICK